MRRLTRLSLMTACVSGALALPSVAIADDFGGVGTEDFEVFNGPPIGSQGSDPIHSSHGNKDLASPNMFHTANRPNPGVTNSDLAFWKQGGVRGPHQDLAAAGNYDGFRLFDIKDPDNPVLVSSMRCRGPQNDVSFYKADNRLLLIQSVDRAQSTDDCSSVDTPIAVGQPECDTEPCPPRRLAQAGFEGLRIFDVSRPETPVLIKTVATACGSHTHTTIPDQNDQRAIIYVSSYPTGASPTPKGGDFGGPRCTIPHKKISIVEIPDKNPEGARVLKEQPLDNDTLPFLGTIGSGGTGAIGCHDITVYYENQKQNVTAGGNVQRDNPSRVAGAACLEEGQLWDVTEPENPTTIGPRHSHIRNLFITAGVPGTFKGLWHTASFSWDGQIVLFTDEFAGGGGHACDGPQDTRGNVFFYENVEPGTPVVPLYGRFALPRPQPQQEVCTLHNGNVIPTNEGYFGVSSAYEGGTSVFDFSDVQDNPRIMDPLPGEPGDLIPPTVGREIAFFDEQGVDGNGRDDVWSSYWHNDRIYANGGLGRAHNPGGRGFDVYKLLSRNGRLVDDEGNPTFRQGDDPNAAGVQEYRARKLPYQNPQTQDTYATVGGGQ